MTYQEHEFINYISNGFTIINAKISSIPTNLSLCWKYDYKYPIYQGSWINEDECTKDIRNIYLKICRCKKWEKLIDKEIKTLHYNSKLIAIGHIKKDIWYRPATSDIETRPLCDIKYITENIFDKNKLWV